MKTLLDWDLWIQKSINSDMAHPYNDWLMTLWSAEWPWFLVVFGFAYPIVRGKQWPRLLSLLWIGVTIGINDAVSHNLLKPLFGRIRPCRVEGLVRIVDGCAGFYSYPSNHAANAAVFVTLWFLIMNRFQGKLAIFCAFIIGCSRIYLGVHYPTDILGGFILGTLLGLLSYWIWQKLPLAQGLAGIEEGRV